MINHEATSVWNVAPSVTGQQNGSQSMPVGLLLAMRTSQCDVGGITGSASNQGLGLHLSDDPGCEVDRCVLMVKPLLRVELKVAIVYSL